MYDGLSRDDMAMILAHVEYKILVGTEEWRMATAIDNAYGFLAKYEKSRMVDGDVGEATDQSAKRSEGDDAGARG